MSKSQQSSFVIGFMLFLFAIFVTLWFYVYNRYSILYFHEQMQLFRCDGLYFRSYLSQLGGLSGYLGSFLTQFYFYPALGSMIITCTLISVFLLFYFICRSCGNIGRLFFIPFIPVILLMRSYANIHFDMAYSLGLLLALAGFCYYIMLRPPIRYLIGFVLFAMIYFVAGGNALLLSVLIIIFELFETKHRYKYPYILLLVTWSVLLPWLAWQMLYTVPIREAYFALTPVDFPFPKIVNTALWFSFPVLYLIWRVVAAKVTQWNFSSWKVLVPNCLVVIIMTTAYSAYSIFDRRTETLIWMAFETQRCNWKRVLALSKTYPTKNHSVSYFTNIALAESGQMPYSMFQYQQTGIAGLFLDWQINYFSLWYFGEVYYRLGIIPEAEHCAFEALVSSPKKPTAQTLRRLVYTNITRRDSAITCKYLGYFDHSPMYRKWAQQQRAYLTSAMADTTFCIPGMPQSANCKDFFTDPQNPEQTLLTLLRDNPYHRMAFEYLMAYYLLQKDIKNVKGVLDTFYKNFDYSEMPVHYEEALIMYRTLEPADTTLSRQYPASATVTKRFEQYAEAYKMVQRGNKRNFEQLEKQFGNTYWYYMHFVEPVTLQKKDEKNRY